MDPWPRAFKNPTFSGNPLWLPLSPKSTLENPSLYLTTLFLLGLSLPKAEAQSSPILIPQMWTEPRDLHGECHQVCEDLWVYLISFVSKTETWKWNSLENSDPLCTANCWKWLAHLQQNHSDISVPSAPHPNLFSRISYLTYGILYPKQNSRAYYTWPPIRFPYLPFWACYLATHQLLALNSVPSQSNAHAWSPAISSHFLSNQVCLSHSVSTSFLRFF